MKMLSSKIRNFFRSAVLLALLFGFFNIFGATAVMAANQLTFSPSPSSITLSSTPQTLTYTVTATRPVKNLQTPVITGTVPAYAVVSVSGGTCTGATLLATQTCAFSVSLTQNSSNPGTAGDSFSLRMGISGDGVNSKELAPGVTVISSGGSAATLQSISITPTSASVAAGNTEQFSATCTFTNGAGTCPTLTWASSAESVATVNSSGLATGVSAGSANITAGASGVTSNNGELTVTAPPSIAVTEPSLMFINRNFGNTSGSNYNGTLTVQNTGSSAVTNITATPSSGSNITYVSALPSGCTTSLAASSSCVLTFSSAIPLTSPSTSTISVTADDISTPLSIPVASISVVALAPPLNNLPSSSADNYRNFEGLTLVAGCDNTQATTGDAGLLEITNNSSTTLSAGITAAITGLTGVTITNPAKSSTNNYCNGATLTTGQYCEVRVNVSTAVAGATGTITLSGTGTNPVGVATSVVAQASSFPYSTGSSAGTNYIFVANNSCNLVEELAAQSDTQNNINWTNANTYCSGTINTHSDWRFPDVGPTPGVTSGSSISGEFATLYNSNSPLAGMSTSNAYWGPNIAASNAWLEVFNGGSQYRLNKSVTGDVLYVRCARAFTT